MEPNPKVFHRWLACQMASPLMAFAQVFLSFSGLTLLLWTADPSLVTASTANTPKSPVYGYRVVDKLAQPRNNWVQGIQILDGHIYLSAGKYGESRLLRYRLNDGVLVDGRKVDSRLFAEGLTVLDNRIYQLTWRSRLVLVYNRSDLKGIEYFRIPGEGWGLTHDGRQLIYSDGSNRLHFLSPESKSIVRTLQVTENGQPVEQLNELEWINGEIWANVWRQDRIVIIDPTSGKVSASIDMRGLLPDEERRPGTNVLNGIALNPDDGAIWVTGKYWPWLYQVEIIKPGDQEKHSEAPASDSR